MRGAKDPRVTILYLSGIIIVTLDGFGDLGTFLVGLTFFPRVGPHDLGIQIDIVGAFLLCQGTLGRWPCERGKN